ncbi:MAG: helix-turn-helix domain-containing protein [Chloroflexota bacterium]
MWQREVRLTTEQRAELEGVLRHDPKPYRRERAAAILQVANGTPAARVAASGLLVRRDPDTVYGWLDRYDEQGIAGLTIAAGRGRHPILSPPADHRSG